MGINYTLSSPSLQSQESPPSSSHIDLSTEFLRTCGQAGPLYDYSHVQNIFYRALLNCGYELQQLQNSYNAFDLLSQVGSQIHSHLQCLLQYKLTGHNTPNVYSKLKLLRYTPLAFNQSNAKIRVEVLSKALTRVTRGINIWAYHQDTSPSVEGFPSPPSVNCVTFDRTGNVILTGGGDGIIKIWHSNTGSQIMSLSRHPGAITFIDIHPNNTFISSACDGGECRLWEIRGSWWRLSCAITSRFKFLWCKFTTLKTAPYKQEDILICACGDGSMQLHLLSDLIQGRDIPLKTVNLTNLRAYDISHRGIIPWLAMGLESGDTDSSDNPSKLGVATLIELDSSSWSESLKLKHKFLWDPPSPGLWSSLEELGYLAQLNPAPPKAQVQPGQYSHKFSLTIKSEENSSLINSIPKGAFSVVSSFHQESPDVCFCNLSRNLVTASDEGNAFLWNMYTGESIKLVTKCMTLFESKAAKQSDNNTGPIYTITCLEWSCDDSLIYIGDSIYSKGNSRKSLSSMRTIESGFTVFNTINGQPICHGLHNGSSYNLSSIKANPLIPNISLVTSYSGNVYLFEINNKPEPNILKKIYCGPGACWLDAVWHPDGSMFVLSQKYGCFSIFSLPTFTFAASDIARTADESISQNIKGDRFVFGCGGPTLPAIGFVPLHHSLCPELINYINPNLIISEPSNMGNLIYQIDDLEFSQKCDLNEFISAHMNYEQDFDNIICCFHYLQSNNIELMERLHDWKRCKVCCIILQNNESQYRQNVETRLVLKSERKYSEYGDHVPCLPQSIKSQIKSLNEPAPTITRPAVKFKPGILLKLLQAPSFDSDDSDDSDFTASPCPTRPRRPAAYSTRLSSKGKDIASSTSSSDEDDDVPRRRRRKRTIPDIRSTQNETNEPSTIQSAPVPRPKVTKFDITSIDHLLYPSPSTNRYCFVCALSNNKSSINVISDLMMGRINDTLIGPIIMDRQSVDAIVANINAELAIQEAKSSKQAYIYLHHCCLATIDSISIQPNGITGLDVALYRASETKCTLCDLKGAALHCKNCNLPYHSKCSFTIYDGFRIYPNPIVGDFICPNCSRTHASDYMNGFNFSKLSREWLFGGFDPQARATRSRLRAQLSFKRVVGRGDEWITPQEGDILWFEGLNMDTLMLSDRLIPLYLHYSHVSFAALVTGVTPLYSGYGHTPQLMLNLQILILPPHPCYGITISIYSYRNDSRYTHMNKLILGLAVQNMLAEDDNLLVHDSTGEWRSAKVVGINNKCRRLLDFDSTGSDLIKRIDRAIQAAKNGIKVKINNKRDGDGYSNISGWQVEPTGDVLNIVGTMAEQVLEAEFSDKKRQVCENILELLNQSPLKHQLDEIYSSFTELVPRPISLQDISQALNSGQISSFDELVKLYISNAFSCSSLIGDKSEENQSENDKNLSILNKFSNYYEKLKSKNKTSFMGSRDIISDALDRLATVCKIAFYKQTR